jgi:hypothetical protein
MLANCAVALLGFWRLGWLADRRNLRYVRWLSGHWRLRGAGVNIAATLQPGSRIVGRLIWLPFATELGSRHVLLWGRGPMQAAERTLRIRLRAQSEPRSDSQSGFGEHSDAAR